MRCEKQLESIQITYDELKVYLLQINNDGHMSIQEAIEILERNGVIRRMARQFMKSTRYLNELFIESETIMTDDNAVLEIQPS